MKYWLRGRLCLFFAATFLAFYTAVIMGDVRRRFCAARRTRLIMSTEPSIV